MSTDRMQSRDERRDRRTARPVALVLAVALALTAAACGGSADDSEALANAKAKATGQTVAPTDDTAPTGDAAAPAPADGEPAPASGAPAATPSGGAKPRASSGGAARATTATTVAVANRGARAATESRVGVTRDSIKIGHHWPKSGPFGPLLRTYMAHFELYFSGKGGLNDRGGVGGRKVTLVEGDDQGTPAGAAAAARQLESAGVFAVYGHSGAAGQVAALSYFDQKRVPYLANGLMSTHVKSSPHGFTFLTPYDLVAAALPSYINGFMKLKGKKVALMWEEPDWPIPRDAFLREAKAEGLDITHVEAVQATQPSYVQNVDKVRASGAQVVVIIGRLSAPGILRDARAIGYSPTWTGMGAWTLNLFNSVSGNLMEGIKAIRQWHGVDSKKYAEYKAFLAANGRADEATEEGYGGWMIGFFLEHVLARGGADLTREAFLEGLEATDTDPIALTVTPPVRYAKGRHWQSEEALPVQVKDGAWVKIGDFARRF